MEDSFPCSPGLTLLIPLWQDKGLQIICLQFLALLIFISAARTALLAQLSKLLENLCVHDTMSSDVQPTESLLLFVTVVPGKERNPSSLLWMSQECPGINHGSCLLGCPRGKHVTVYSAVQLGSGLLAEGELGIFCFLRCGLLSQAALVETLCPCRVWCHSHVIAAGQKPDMKSPFSRFLHPGEWC